jgi:PTS system mannose-specific IIC component
MHQFVLAGIAALVGGAAAVERKGAFQLMLSRPLVLAPLLGWCLGDAQGGLLLGVPLELLYLGAVNLGGNLPDNETLLAAALTAMVVPAGHLAKTGVDPALAAMGLLLLFPLAYVGRRLERASDLRNAQLLDAAEKDPLHLERHNLRGLWLPFFATAGICAAAALVSPFFAWLRMQCSPAAVVALSGAWHAVFAVAAATAVRAIRDPRAPIIAAISAALVAIAGIAFFRSAL